MRSVSTTVTLPEATNDSLVLIQIAQFRVARTWHEAPGDRPWRYSKAGVITTDLMPLGNSPRALIGRLRPGAQRSSHGGHGRVQWAVRARNRRAEPRGARRDAAWSTKFEMRSPRYTTLATELPTALA